MGGSSWSYNYDRWIIFFRVSVCVAVQFVLSVEPWIRWAPGLLVWSWLESGLYLLVGMLLQIGCWRSVQQLEPFWVGEVFLAHDFGVSAGQRL